MLRYRRAATWRLLIAALTIHSLAVAQVAGASPQAPALPLRLTLAIATEILLENNPTILADRQLVVAARADVQTAGQLHNPVLAYAADSVGGSPLPNPSFWDDQDLSLTVEQRLRIGGSGAKLERVADQGVVSAESDLQDTVRRLVLDLETRYYAVILAKQGLALATEILTQFDQVIELTEQRYEVGEASGLELARLSTERLRFETDRVEASLGLANAKTALLELMGVRRASADFEVSETLVFQPVATQAHALEAQALANRPDLAARRSRLEQARLRQDYERSLRVPDVTPYFGYNRDFGQENVTFGVSVALPIFNRNQGGQARAIAQTNREQQLLLRDELAVRRDVRIAVNEVAARAALVDSMEATYVPSAERARDIAQASYSLGALDLIAFLDAERAYRETVRGYYRALYDHHIARFVLRAVVGRGGSR